MTILTDSMAREHQAEIQSLVRNNSRVREARLARRSQRRAGRRARRGARAATLVRPFSAVQHWLVAGQL